MKSEVRVFGPSVAGILFHGAIHGHSWSQRHTATALSIQCSIVKKHAFSNKPRKHRQHSLREVVHFLPQTRGRAGKARTVTRHTTTKHKKQDTPKTNTSKHWRNALSGTSKIRRDYVYNFSTYRLGKSINRAIDSQVVTPVKPRDQRN